MLARIDEAGVRDAVDGVWDAFLGDLTRTLYLFAACGGVVAAAASSLLRPVDLAAPLRKGARAVRDGTRAARVASGAGRSR